MSKIRLATVWLDGCSGCHMSFLDMDEALITLAEKVELVYSPLVDVKTFPDEVDITLVEGAVSSEGGARRRSSRSGCTQVASPCRAGARGRDGRRVRPGLSAARGRHLLPAERTAGGAFPGIER